MLTVVSPAKTLDFDVKVKTKRFSEPAFLDEAEQLVNVLREFQPKELSSLMDISDNLAIENFRRYAAWRQPFNLKNAKQAIFTFKGDVYIGLRAEQFNAADLSFAQKHLRILSGLYGVLRPLDLMQAYRLEMGRKLTVNGSKDLYDFWGSKITNELNGLIRNQKQGNKTLINLASNEYFKSIILKSLDAEIVTPVFKDWSGGKYKVISFFAKKARGEMAAYIVKNKITSSDGLKLFSSNNYCFSEEESSHDKFVFKRKQSNDS